MLRVAPGEQRWPTAAWRGLAVAAVLAGSSSAADPAEPSVRFVEVAREAGLDFTHVNGMTGKRWLVETVGAGVGMVDVDDDGWLDVYLVQGGPLEERAKAELPTDRLFMNRAGGGALRFEDATAQAGIRATGYGMAVATGDVDNDGDWDVFLANYGANQLLLNRGDGRFLDATAEWLPPSQPAASASGAPVDPPWSAAASFADMDGDGWLDLYVGNYLDFTLAKHRDCRDLASRLSYCAPSAYHPVADQLFRNTGKGFVDASPAAGIAASRGGALGVAAADFDDDGRVDFYVANDGMANQLWLNQGRAEGRFQDAALLAGVALNGNGAAEASMGVAAADYDGDCDIDLFLTHLRTETNTLYVNEGGWFRDATNGAALAASSAAYTGFGTAWFDVDHDGDLDLFSANGAVRELTAQREAGDPYPLRQRNQLWLNAGDGRFLEHSGALVPNAPAVSRGAAFGDLDNDGDLDIVVANNNGPAQLFRNDSSTAANAWLGIDLRAAPGQAVIGATVALARTGDATEGTPRCRRQRIATDGSYASASDPRVVFGLGANAAPQFALVRWPQGDRERFGPLAPGRYHRLRQGKGQRWPAR